MGEYLRLPRVLSKRVATRIVEFAVGAVNPRRQFWLSRTQQM
jgi:hypothetical protein